MSNSILPLVIGAWALGAGAQGAAAPAHRFPLLPKTASSAKEFAPRGWEVETQARGDMNGDGLPDLAFVLLPLGASKTPLPSHVSRKGDPPRMFAFALARAGGGYELALRNHKFLPPKRSPNGASQGYMLFEDGSVEVSRGRLRTMFQYTRGHTTFTFRWQDGELRLMGYDSAAVSAGCLHDLSINFLSHRAKMTAGYVDREENKVRWRRLAGRPLLKIDQIGDGEEFDPYGFRWGFDFTCPEKE